jgi:hypothetical protein
MDDVRPLPTPAGWLEALDRAEADVGAGRVVDGADIHAELAATIERMKRRKAEADTSGSPETR